MIVECPACHTRYRTDSAGVIAEDTFFECSQEECRYIFPYTPPLLRGGNSEVLEADVSFQPQFAENQQPLDDTSLDDVPVDDPLSRFSHQDPESSSEPFTELEDFPAPEVPFFAEGEEDNSLAATSPPDAAPATEIFFSPRPLFGLFGLLIVGYAGLTFYCFSHLAETEALLARLPLLGSLFTAERISAQQIALLDLEGQFWLTKDGRRVFAISGKAMNDAPAPARNIQIEGTMYAPDGQMMGRRVIFCGTETAAAVLERLTIREIGILQNLVPPKQFHIPAGQSVNFLIVFTNLPSTVAEFSCRVLTAQFGES